MNRETLAKARPVHPRSAPWMAPPSVRSALHSPGRPLDAGPRAFMESRFRNDFSRVRIHTDPKAAESAREVNALAYTVGRDVVFGARQYAPQTSAGQSLLAHELAHVLQQGSADRPAVDLAVGPADDVHEHTADRQARSVIAGGRAGSLPGGSAPSLQRQPAAPQDDAKKKPGEKTVVTQPSPQKIPATQAAKAEKAKPEAEKKGVEAAVSVGVETETKKEEDKTKTEVAGKYKIEVVIPITDKLQIGPLSFFKEVGLEASAGLHSSTGPRSPLTSIELQAATKLVSLDFEKVKIPFGLVDLGLSFSPQAAVEHSPMESKTTDKFGFAAEAEAKYKRSEKSPFFIDLKVGVEKTYDKEGNADFKWSPAVWKTAAAVGVEF